MLFVRWEREKILQVVENLLESVKARKKRGDGGFSFHSCPFHEEGKKFLFGVRGQGISFKEIDSEDTSITTKIELFSKGFRCNQLREGK